MQQPVPLLVHLWRTGQTAPVEAPKMALDPAAWISRLGTNMAA